MTSRDGSPPPARLVLIDDHAVLSEAVGRALVLEGFAVEVVDPVTLTDEAVLATTQLGRPDIVLLDLFLGEGRLAIPLIGPLTRLGARVIVVTASRERVLLAECLVAGAVALYDKSDRFESLIDLVHRAARGEPVIDEERVAALLGELKEATARDQDRWQRLRSLTPSEEGVLRLLVDGRSPKQIAVARAVSVSTVRNQIQAVLAKLDVSSAREALALAREAGWPLSR